MKKSLFVASVMSKLDVPKTALENDITKYNRFSRCKNCFDEVQLPGFEKVLWHFANIPVSGQVEIVFANKWNNKILSVDVPATTGFLATCIQTRSGTQLTFGASLS